MMTEEIESILPDPEHPGIGMPFRGHSRIQEAIAGKDQVGLAEIADAWYSKSLHHRMDIMSVGVALSHKIGKQECWMGTTEGEFTFFFVGDLDDVVETIIQVMPSWDTVVIPDRI